MHNLFVLKVSVLSRNYVDVLTNMKLLLSVGCRSDSDCPITEACVNRDCTDPCLYTQCGQNAVCKSDYNHKARCVCLDNYKGDPFTKCIRPECTRDDDCPFNLACQNEKCRDPCDCAPGAQCRVTNHQALCRCPPGYEGNGRDSCKLIQNEIQYECSVDADCSSKLACFNRECKNPCIESKPCGTHAICTVIDTLPLRTMICQCEPGYSGNADSACFIGKCHNYLFLNEFHLVFFSLSLFRLLIFLFKQKKHISENNFINL